MVQKRATVHPAGGVLVRHLDSITSGGKASPPGAEDLFQRATGKFYTPVWMALQMADRILDMLGSNLAAYQVVDPFAGDGRLLVALMERIANEERWRRTEWNFEAWDTDESALSMARVKLSESARTLGLRAKLRIRRRDSFLESRDEFGKFDLVVTNPPWESLKPDSRELRGLWTRDRQRFVMGMRDYDRRLAVELPNSQPATKLYGWGTNLSRCGLEVTVKLMRSGGCCGIVLPSSLLADQISAPLRRWVFSRMVVQSIDYYPAEAKPFDGVDQPCVVMVGQRDETGVGLDPVILRHDRERKEIARERIRLCPKHLEALEFRLPVELCAKELQLLLKLVRFKPLSDWESLRGGPFWMGRELDETGFHSFTGSSGEFAFIKGRDITRFGAVHCYKDFVTPGAREIPASARTQRVAWRDVARRSQARRMVATLIPAGVVTGNSLHVASCANDGQDRLYALLGIINSLVFEFQLRSRLGTGHVSIGAVRGVRVPDLNDSVLVKMLSRLVKAALDGEEMAEARIETVIADAFSLSRDDRGVLLKHFHGLSAQLEAELRTTFGFGAIGEEEIIA